MFNKKCIFGLFCVLFAYYAGDVNCAVRTAHNQNSATPVRTTTDSTSPNRRSTVSEQNISDSTRTTSSRKTVSPSTSTQTPLVVVRSAAPARSTAARNVVTRSAVQTPATRTVTRGASSVSSNTRPEASKKTTARVTSLPTNKTISIKNSTTKQDVMSKEDMDNYAEMLEYCKTQYSNCMDQYCDILDSDLGRCSCSVNINNYSKTEQALEAATEALRDIAQQIQYIGLSAKEIEVIFSETEAEAKMSDTKDSSQLKADLDKIKKMIIDVQPARATSNVTETSGISVDLSGLLSFDFNADSFNLDSILGNTSSTESISNQRGAKLYKTAAARCKSNVLTFCKEKGIEEKLVTNNYDIQIDKDCLSYEKFLKDSNANMSSTVRNAEDVLRKARLALHKNANAYDLAGCVSALDECMRSDFVCGSDYENCLDPTGKYIVNGEVVLGSDPTNVYDAWKYDGISPWDDGNIADYLNEKLWTSKPNGRSSFDMAQYLQYRIGYYDKDKNYGLCMGVLNQCQNYTYNNAPGAARSFEYGNSVISEYLTRVLPEIKRQQDALLTDYAQNCITEVTQCLTTNGYETSSKEIAKSSCSNLITTCSALNTSTNTSGYDEWVASLFGSTSGGDTDDSGDDATCSAGQYVSGSECKPCTNKPTNASYTGPGTAATNCPWQCNSGYSKNGNTCVKDDETTVTITYVCGDHEHETKVERDAPFTVLTGAKTKCDTEAGTVIRWKNNDQVLTPGTAKSATGDIRITAVYICNTGYTKSGDICVPDEDSDACPSGYYRPTLNSECEPAKNGYFAPGTSTPTQMKCPKGSYSEYESASTKCIPCPKGKTTADSGTHYDEDSDAACSVTCDNANYYVKTWEEPSFGSTQLTNSCKIKACTLGYKLQDNKCVDEETGATYDLCGATVDANKDSIDDDDTYNDEDSTWSAEFSYGTISGIALLSGLNRYIGIAISIEDLPDGDGYCWCKMTYPKDSKWVSSGPMEDITALLKEPSCARACSYSVRTSSSFREALFETPESSSCKTADEPVTTLITLHGNGDKTVTATFGKAMPPLTTRPTDGTKVFMGYYDGTNSSTAKKYYNADLSSARNWNRTDKNVTLYPIFEACLCEYVPVVSSCVPKGASTTDNRCEYQVTFKDGRVITQYGEPGEYDFTPQVESICSAGNYPTNNECKPCAKGSYSGDNNTVCIVCDEGQTTAATGATSSAACTACGNASNVKTWETPSWNPSTNQVTPLCEIEKCVTGYTLQDNKCVPDEGSGEETSTITLLEQKGYDQIAITQTVTATRGEEMPPIINIVPKQTFRDYVFTGYYDGTGSTATQYYTWDLRPARNWDKSAGEYTLYPIFKECKCTFDSSDATLRMTKCDSTGVDNQNRCTYSVIANGQSGTAVGQAGEYDFKPGAK